MKRTHAYYVRVGRHGGLATAKKLRAAKKKKNGSRRKTGR